MTFEFLKVGLFNLAHEHGDFILLKEELEMYAAYALSNKVGLDVENIVASPHGSGGVWGIVDRKRAIAHEANSEVYSMGRIALFKRNT